MYTSDIRHAGTDAEVYINLFGNKGRSGRVVLGDGLKDSDQFFERGSVDVFSPEVSFQRLVLQIVFQEKAGIYYCLIVKFSIHFSVLTPILCPSDPRYR